MDKVVQQKLHVIDLSKKFDSQVKFRVPTGILAIDRIIGGGVPSGKLTEINGTWSAGKSRLLLHILAKILEQDGLVMLVDLERALEKGLAEIAGLDYNHENFLYANVDKIITVEDVFKLLGEFIEWGRKDFKGKLMAFAIDSIAAMPTEELLKKEVGAEMMAPRRAQLIDNALKKYIPQIHKSNICFICINQLRDRLNVMFGDKTSTPGGKAIKFYSSLRLNMKLIGKEKDKKTEEQIASKVQIINQKSKIGVPFGMVRFEMPVIEPISPYAGLLDYMERHGEAEKVGPKMYKFVGAAEEFHEDDFIEMYEKMKKGDKT